MSEYFKLGKPDARPKHKYLINILGRVVGSRFRKNNNDHSLLLRSVNNLFERHVSKPETVIGNERFNQLQNLHSQTKLWHGTGRYQYKDGEVVDVLKYIASHGALHPQPDGWDFSGPMTTISLAPSRVYARAYADMHGRGVAEQDRYGSSFFWAAFFVGDMKVEGFLEGRVRTLKGLRAARRHIEKNTDLWYRKVSSIKLSTMEAFYLGSDIPNNYPIIFGVKGDAIDQAPTTRTVAIHEVRARNPLQLIEEVTYIEVPREQIEETKQILAEDGHEALPVTAIEDNEAYATTKPFSQLVANRWPRQEIINVDSKKVLKSLLGDEKHV